MPRRAIGEKPMTAAERQARRRARVAAGPRTELGLPVIDPRAVPLNLDHLRRWPGPVADFLAERLTPAEYAALVEALEHRQVDRRQDDHQDHQADTDE